MSNAEFERKIFWDMYNEILINNGEPFSISSKKQWAIVNKNSPAWNEPVIAMDFLVQKKVLRINAFLLDDEYLFAKLLGMKEEIEETLGFAPEWVPERRSCGRPASWPEPWPVPARCSRCC